MNVVPHNQNHTFEEFESSISPKGQITIPVQIRQKLGITTKDKIVLRVENDVIKLMPPHPSLDDVYMSVPKLTVQKTIEEMREIIHQEQAERTVQLER